MKNLIAAASVIVAGMVFGTNVAVGQTSKTAQVNVTLEFNDVMSLTVNSNQTEVKLSYNSMEDYLDGVEATKEQHLTVFSINPFQVKVAARDNNQFGTSDIDTESVRVSAVGFENVTPTEQSNVNVSATGQAIFKSNQYSNGGTVDINYSTKGAPGLKGQAVGKHVGQTYSKVFIYSIEAL